MPRKSPHYRQEGGELQSMVLGCTHGTEFTEESAILSRIDHRTHDKFIGKLCLEVAALVTERLLVHWLPRAPI